MLSAYVPNGIAMDVIVELRVFDVSVTTGTHLRDLLLKYGANAAQAQRVQAFLDMGQDSGGVIHRPATPSPTATPVWELHVHRSAEFVDVTPEMSASSCLTHERLTTPANPGYLRFVNLISANLKKLDVMPLEYALTTATRLPDGIVVEVGVADGETVTKIANALAPTVIYGFGSFVGLPEDWVRGPAVRGTFMAGCWDSADMPCDNSLRLVLNHITPFSLCTSLEHRQVHVVSKWTAARRPRKRAAVQRLVRGDAAFVCSERDTTYHSLARRLRDLLLHRRSPEVPEAIPSGGYSGRLR